MNATDLQNLYNALVAAGVAHEEAVQIVARADQAYRAR